jgi:hypothetical protein
MGGRLCGEMLPAPEADLEPDLRNRSRKKALGAGAELRGIEGKLRERRLEERLLPGAELAPAAPAMERKARLRGLRLCCAACRI